MFTQKCNKLAAKINPQKKPNYGEIHNPLDISL